MSIPVSCPQCGICGYVPTAKPGRKIHCRSCNTTFKVPGGEETVLASRPIAARTQLPARAAPTQLAEAAEEEPPRPATPRPARRGFGWWGVVALVAVALALLAGTVWAAWTIGTAHARSRGGAAALAAPGIGEVGHVYVGKLDGLPAATDFLAQHEFERYFAAKDEEGMSQMIGKKSLTGEDKLVLLEPHTKVRVIRTVGESSEVRVLDGKHQGKALWVLTFCLRKEPDSEPSQTSPPSAR